MSTDKAAAAGTVTASPMPHEAMRAIIRHPLILHHMRPDESAARQRKRMDIARLAWDKANANGRDFTVVLAEDLALWDRAWLLRQLGPKAQKQERCRIVTNVRRQYAPSGTTSKAEAMTVATSQPGEIVHRVPRTTKPLTFSELAKRASTSDDLWLEANRAWDQGREGKHVRRVEEERTQLRELFATLADMEYRGVIPGSLPLLDRLLLAVDPTIPLPETKPRKPLTDGDMQAILFQLDLPESVRGVNRAILYDTLKHALETQNPIVPQVAIEIPTDVQPFGLDGALLPSDPTLRWDEAPPDEQARRIRRYRYLARRFLRSTRGLKLHHRKMTLTLPRGFDGKMLYPDARTFAYEIEKRGGSVAMTLDLGGKYGRPHWHAELFTDLTYAQIRNLWAESCGATVKQQPIAFIKGSHPTAKSRSESNQTYRIESHRAARYRFKPIAVPTKVRPINRQFLGALQLTLGLRTVASTIHRLLLAESMVLTTAPDDFNPFAPVRTAPASTAPAETSVSVITSTTAPALAAPTFTTPLLLPASVDAAPLFEAPSKLKLCGFLGCQNPVPARMKGYCSQDHTDAAAKLRRAAREAKRKREKAAAVTSTVSTSDMTGGSDAPPDRQPADGNPPAAAEPAPA